MKNYVASLFVAFLFFACSDQFSDPGISYNVVSTQSSLSARNKVEVKEFKYLTDAEKNELSNLVLLDNNLYAKGYAVLPDGYAGIVYYKTESTKILLESAFNNFSSSRWLRFNDANAQALFLYMGFRYIDYPTPAPAPARELRSIFAGITFILPVSISQQIMADYNCTFAVIENAMSKTATSQGGNGIRTAVEANRFNYTSELKIQVMSDKRVFTKDTGTQRTLNIIASGLH